MLPSISWSQKGNFAAPVSLLCEILGVSLGLPPPFTHLDDCKAELVRVIPGILDAFDSA